jgi:hypothetical protein
MPADGLDAFAFFQSCSDSSYKTLRKITEPRQSQRKWENVGSFTPGPLKRFRLVRKRLSCTRRMIIVTDHFDVGVPYRKPRVWQMLEAEAPTGNVSATPLFTSTPSSPSNCEYTDHQNPCQLISLPANKFRSFLCPPQIISEIRNRPQQHLSYVGSR